MDLTQAVQPQHPVVVSLVETCGCASGSAAVRSERICREFRQWKLSARLGLSSYEVVAAERTGNCIDLSVLLCAVLRATGPEPTYVLMGSHRGRFPAVIHAWVYLFDEEARSWFLVDPVDRRPVPRPPEQVEDELTIIAAWNEQELVSSRAERRALWERPLRGGSMDDQDGPTAAARRAHRREPLVVEEQGEGFHAVLAGQVGAVLITNDVGRHVLELCDGTRTESEIVTELGSRFPDVEEVTLAVDVETFLRTAEEKGTISWHQVGESP